MRTHCRARSFASLALLLSLLVGLLQLGPGLVAADVASASMPGGHAPRALSSGAADSLVTVSGAVTDGSGHGWPLYARVSLAHSPTFTTTVFTDPFTGHYSASVPPGTTYDLHVSAEGGGYQLGTRAIAVGTDSVRLDWALQRDPDDCSAPGYGPTYLYYEDWEASNGGYQVGGSSSWEWGVPTSGPGAAHSGMNAWGTNLDGPYGVYENGSITSPPIDLAPYAEQNLAISWWQSLVTENGYDYGGLELSADGGATWSAVYGPYSGQIEPAWTYHLVWIDPSFATAGFRLRFGFYSDGSVTYSGYYIDDVGIFAAPRTVYQTQDFEQSNGGYTVSGPSSWAWGVPSGTPSAAHSGRKVWATNPQGEYGNNEDGYLVSPPMDLSALAGQQLILSWWQVLILERDYDEASVEVSADGGATWDWVYGPLSGLVDAEWTRHEAYLDPRYAVSNLRVRFHLRSDTSFTKAGFAIDDVKLGPLQDTPVAPCDAQPGGLVVGFVRDANTGVGLPGALVQPDRGQIGRTLATPVDQVLDDGWYRLFAPAGARTLTAKGGVRYGQDTRSVAVVDNGLARVDLALPAGWLVAEPAQIELEVLPNTRGTAILTLTNRGTLSTSFEILSQEMPSRSLARQAATPAMGELQPQAAPNAKTLGQPQLRAYASLDSVAVVQQWPIGLAKAWGIAYDLERPGVWVSSPSPSWSGTDTLYRFTTGGLRGPEEYAFSWPHSSGPADLTYDIDTHKIWAMHVGDYDNCIYEMDPYTGYTGNRICPGGSGFGVSQRGLAYDPETDTFFAGSWNDNTIYRFDREGNIVEQVAVGLAIAGLAYNPTNGHLWVTENGGTSDLTLLDARNNYAPLESWVVPGWVLYSGAGLEIDCQGHLWVIDHENDLVQELDVGEPPLEVCQPPWITVSPASGGLAPGATRVITVTLDATSPEASQPGWHRGSLQIINGTPYTLTVPVAMFVTPPATWGELKGQVTGLARCALTPDPLRGAVVEIQGQKGMTQTLRTDDDGRYALWLDSKSSPLTLTFSYPYYETEVLTDVVIAGNRASTVRDMLLLQPGQCFWAFLPMLTN